MATTTERNGRHPRTRWLIGIVACLAGVFITPDILIQLGIMGTSLTSEHEMTRSLAYLEVTALRFLLMAFGLAVIFLLPRLPALADHPRVKPLLQHLPTPLEQLQRKILAPQLLVVALAACAMITGVLMYSNPTALTREDGPLEQFTAWMFLFAGLTGAWTCLRRGLVRRILPLMLISLFFLVAAGEEISWGQRIWNYTTPTVVAQYNVQGEANVHNLFGYLADHLFIAGTLVYGAVLPCLCLRWPQVHRILWRTGVPVASLGLALGFLILSLVHPWTLGQLAEPLTAVRLPEIREALSGLAYLLLMSEALYVERLAIRGSALSRNFGAKDLILPS